MSDQHDHVRLASEPAAVHDADASPFDPPGRRGLAVTIALSGPASNLEVSFSYAGSDAGESPSVYSVTVKRREGDRWLFHCEADASLSNEQVLPNPWRYGTVLPVDASSGRCAQLVSGRYEIMVGALEGSGSLGMTVGPGGVVATAPLEDDEHMTDPRTQAQDRAARERHRRLWNEIAAVPNNGVSASIGGTVLRLEGCRLVITEFDSKPRALELSLHGPCAFAVTQDSKTQVVDTTTGPNLVVLSVRRRGHGRICDTEMRAISVRDGVQVARRKRRSSSCSLGPLAPGYFEIES